jgi:hypothetical protein
VLVPVISKAATTAKELAQKQKAAQAAQAAATAIAISVTAAVAATAAAAAASGAAAAAGSAAGGAAGGASGGASGGSASNAGSNSAVVVDAADAADADEAADAADAAEEAGRRSALQASTHVGDQLSIWSSGLLVLLDRPSRRIVRKIAPVSPLTSKLINDSAYLRAVLGSLSILLPIVAMLLAIVGISDLEGSVVPPATAIFAAIIVIGAFDAFAAFAAMTVFCAVALLRAPTRDLADIRLVLCLILISFGPSMLAGAFRSFRRPAASNAHHWYERLVDLAVGAFIAGWAVKNLIVVLAPLSGKQLLVTSHATQIGIMLAIAVAIRVVSEEVTARYFPGRLASNDVFEFPPVSPVQKNISLTLRAIFFGFVMAAFVGNGVLLYVGTALFIIPAFVGMLSHRFPNVPKLYQVLPGGLPGLAFGLAIATTAGALFAKHAPISGDTGALTFVGATAASALFAIVGMFGREPVEGDVRWYLRPQNKWIYRVGGLLVFIVTLRVTGII